MLPDTELRPFGLVGNTGCRAHYRSKSDGERAKNILIWPATLVEEMLQLSSALTEHDIQHRAKEWGRCTSPGRGCRNSGL